jgi:hypothetical protein
MGKTFDVYESVQGNRIYKLVEDLPGVGVYLYIYENGRCIWDDLQDDFDMCKRVALEDFGVPMDSWVKMN